MARSKPRSSKSAAIVQGAEPYRPEMGQSEVLAELLRVSGTPTRLGDLRQEMPVARLGQSGEREETAAAPQGAARRESSARNLTPELHVEDREILVDQAVLLLREVYAHLPLKRALHAIDPIQRLQLLRLRLDTLEEREFHSELIDTFVSLRDLHTNYTLPEAYWPKFAFLPFRVEEYYVKRQRKYLVSWVSPKNTEPKLTAGLEITHWNGSPIDLVVARNAAREAGSNPEARRARGLEALTLRWLAASLPPDEDWVTLTCIDSSGRRTESRHEWQVVTRDDLRSIFTAGESGDRPAAMTLGVDVKTELLRRVRKALFDPPATRADAEMANRAASDPLPVNASVMPDVYPRFGPVKTPSGEFGYIRLATFAPGNNDVDLAVDEFVRLLKLMPQAGLILDVRGNGGGFISFGERILQTLTPHPVTPEPFHFASTPFTLRLAQDIEWLSEWRQPLAIALATGAAFSQGFPLTGPQDCNDIGQIYQGPVVLITDAFCYSTTDIFAAGFQDHRIGWILGCHDNTGAGGANVWDHSDLVRALPESDNPFVALPGGAGMRVSIRRSTRIGAQSGVPLEDLGVIPDERYFMTKADLLGHNADLIARAAGLLASKPACTLALAPNGTPPIRELVVTAKNVDRVDIHVDGRPLLSADIGTDVTTLALPKPIPPGASVVAQGYRRGALVSSVRINL